MRHLAPLCIAVCLVALAVGSAAADEVTDAIAKAQSAYAKSDYREASTELQTALVGVNRKLVDLIIKAMPAPPKGWTADDPEGVDASAFGLGFFANLMVDLTYSSPSGSSIDFSVAANSPLIATYRMFLTNPMLAGMGSGMTKVSVCGYDAIQEFDDDSADLSILAGNATLIKISGESAADREYVMELANATDCKAIVSVVE